MHGQQNVKISGMCS